MTFLSVFHIIDLPGERNLLFLHRVGLSTHMDSFSFVGCEYTYDNSNSASYTQRFFETISHIAPGIRLKRHHGTAQASSPCGFFKGMMLSAPTGHWSRQSLQPVHRPESTRATFSTEMAPAGQRLWQIPHPTHLSGSTETTKPEIEEPRARVLVRFSREISSALTACTFLFSA